MDDRYSRTRMLIGQDAIDRLRAAKVAVFGIGGVGGYVVEALARCGVGTLILVDGDRFAESNLNRQLFATLDSVGRPKTDVASKRVAAIDPTVRVDARPVFYTDDIADEFDFASYDYIVDAIDSVASKISLVLRAKAAGVPIISSMGAGNKLDPSMFRVADIYDTAVDPLAKVMRTRLKKLGVKKLKVVCSTEKPMTPRGVDTANGGRMPPASIAFVPAAAGLVIASEVVCDITGVHSLGSGI